jgi:urease accessory protein
MRTFTRTIAGGAAPTATPPSTVTLGFHQRRRSRMRATLDDGSEVGLVLPRGLVLRDGDLLASDDGAVIRVAAAAEEVSTARTDDARLLARACYHLGNRHVAVEVGAGYARYLHDHVLDHMVRALGLAVAVEVAPFEPEAGAYGGHGHGHDHGHDHGHGHDHDGEPEHRRTGRFERLP